MHQNPSTRTAKHTPTTTQPPHPLPPVCPTNTEHATCLTTSTFSSAAAGMQITSQSRATCHQRVITLAGHDQGPKARRKNNNKQSSEAQGLREENCYPAADKIPRGCTPAECCPKIVWTCSGRLVHFGPDAAALRSDARSLMPQQPSPKRHCCAVLSRAAAVSGRMCGCWQPLLTWSSS